MRLLVLCLLLLTVMCVNATDGLTDRLAKIQKQHGVAAVSVLLVNSESVLLDAQLGVRDWDSQKAFGPDDLFRIGSISKTFAGLLAQRLAGKGLIDLDAPIKEPTFHQYLKNSHEGDITLRQLLEHTAGIQDLSRAEWDHNKPLGLKAAFELKLTQHQTQWPPGQFKSYSNLGTGLFGLVLEHQLGQKYEDLMHQHVFKPLGMTRTNLELTDAAQKALIAGYDRDGKTPIPYWHVIYRPAAAINTHNQDLVPFLQLFLKQGRVGGKPFFSLAQLKDMQHQSSTLGARDGLRHGYGLGLSHWQHNGHDFWGHGGDADGYLSRFGFNPESGLAYFVMINAFNHQAINPLIDVLESHITKDLPKPQYPRRLAQDKDTLAPWLGSYQAVTQRFGRPSGSTQLTLRWHNDQLHFQRPGRRPVPLYRVRDRLFRTGNDTVATWALIQQTDGLYVQTPFGGFKRFFSKTE